MMKLPFCTLALWLCLLAPVFVLAEKDAENAIPDRYRFCAVCHGSKFQGNVSTDSPNLSILSVWYLEMQLIAYKHKLRGGLEADTFGREMQPMMTTLDDRAIWEVSEFIGTRGALSAAVTIEGSISRGRKLYQSCAACHGPEGMGSQALRAPRLAGQNDWYLIRQLNSYKRGLRGVSKRDPYGAQMRQATLNLADQGAIRDVVVFINSL